MPGQNYPVKFTYSGMFPYFCMVHPWMTGTVIVDGGSSSTPTPASEPDTLSISVPRSSYQSGDRLSISGLASNDNVPISTFIYAPNGNVVLADQRNPSNGGKFTVRVETSGSMWAQTGTYTVTAKQGVYLSASDDFYFTAEKSQASPELDLQVARSSYQSGDTISVSGYCLLVILTPIKLLLRLQVLMEI